MPLLDRVPKFFVDDVIGVTHPYYMRSIEMAEAIEVHTKGITPTKMLEITRPNEKPQYLEYRALVYKPITRTYAHKVRTALWKVSGAEDFTISYPKTDGPQRSAESLEDYTEVSYPEFDSFKNMWYSYGKDIQIEDANAVCAVLPINLLATDNELRKPVARFFSSRQVIEFLDSDFCCLLDEEKSDISTGSKFAVGMNDTIEQSGNIFHFLDATTYIKAVQIGRREDNLYQLTQVPHGGSYMPAFKVGQKIRERKSGRTLYESVLTPCLPFWDEATADFSDHQVNKKLHLHPNEWEIADTECPSCQGTGLDREHRATRLNPNAQRVCPTCLGVGNIITKSPFHVKLVKPAKQVNITDRVQTPIPPMGVVPRDVEAIKFLKEEIKDLLKQGLAAINMEHLYEEPITNSGVAKSVDRQDFKDLLIHNVKQDVENIFNPCYEFICNWRYGYLPEDRRYALLPVITAPVKIDVITAELAALQLAQAIEKNYAPAIIKKLEILFAQKEFGTDSIEVQILEATHKLDPLPYLTPAEKNELLVNSMNPGTSYENYLISTNLDAFINRALNEQKNFLSLDYTAQMALLKTYAGELKPVITTPVIPFNTTPDAPTEESITDTRAAG